MSSIDPKKPDDSQSTGPIAHSNFGESLPGVNLVSDGDVNLGELPSQFGDVIHAQPPSAASGQSAKSWSELLRRPNDVPAATPAKLELDELDATSTGVPVAQSRYGENLPGIDLVSEGDIDLGQLPSKFGDTPAAPIPPAPGGTPSNVLLATSHAGESLPGVELVSQGDIDLRNLPSRAGDVPVELPDLTSTKPLKSPKEGRSSPADLVAQSQYGEALTGIELASDGDINLGELPSHFGSVPTAQIAESPSSQSLTSWSEVIRRQRAALTTTPTADTVKVDAASDKDLLTRLVEAESRRDLSSGSNRLPRSGDTDEIPEGSLPVFKQPRSESEIDLGLLSGPTGGESEIKFDILYPPSDAGGAMPIPSGEAPPQSAVDFRDLMPSKVDTGVLEDEAIPYAVEIGTDASDLNLGGDVPAVAGEPGRSSILGVLLREPHAAAAAQQESDLLDYGDAPPVRSAKPTMPTTGAGPAKSMHVPTQPGIDLTGGDMPPESAIMNLEGPASGYGEDDSIDLYSEGGAAANITDSGTLEISKEVREEAQRRSESQESSAIDLNSRPSYSGSDFDLSPGSAPNRGSEADIDLSLPSVDDGGSSSLIQPPEGLAANREALAVEFESRRRQGDEPSRRSRPRDIVPVREEYGSRSGRGYLIRGGVLGLLLGAGGVFAAYFGGALPDRGTHVRGDTDPDAKQRILYAEEEIKAAQARTEALSASFRKALVDGGVENAYNPVDGVKKLVADKNATEKKAADLALTANSAKEMLTVARKAEADAKAGEEAAKKNLSESEKAASAAKLELADATKSAAVAKKELGDATKALEVARKETTDAKKVAEDKLAVARATAEAKEKEATAKLAEVSKKEMDLSKLVDAARKTADDATKARDASDATVKAISDRLAKAKFVGDKADTAALVSGLDAAIKAATTDSTSGLREELVKARDAETKLKTDLAAAREKEAESAKVATVLKSDAQKLQQDIRSAETKAAADTAKLRGDVDKLSKDFADANAKSVAAEKVASQEKAQADRLGTELSKLKTDNDRLAKDLEAVKDLAAFLKTAGNSGPGPLVRPEPSKLADRFFNEGLREFYAGRYVEAESNFRKALQFNMEDARVHYLIGLSLWMTKDAKGAEAEFAKGRDLELAGRPASRTISAVLERIQGPARQAVNAYRP